MIDWHSHILPGMDDGSRNVDESAALLDMLAEQGVGIAAATPHFDADAESVETFLERRQASFESLADKLAGGPISVLPGAEVRYYPGIGKLAGLKQLCIGNGKLLLLEMPMAEWTEYTVRELIEMENAKDVRLILAHIERYLPMQRREVWDRLREVGIFMQVNASFFTELPTKRRALSLLRSGHVQLIGSDCHSVRHRPPRLGKAYETVRKKFGDEFVTQLDEYGRSLLTHN